MTRLTIRRRPAGAAIVALIVVSLFLARQRLSLMVHRYRREFMEISLDQSPYLRDVAEPIAMTKGTFHAGSDDHWMGLTFKDSSQVERYAEFVHYVPGTKDTLILGKNRVTGREECVFLGLLQRWAWHHPEIGRMRERASKCDLATGATPLDRGELTDEQVGMLVAGEMIRILLKRN